MSNQDKRTIVIVAAGGVVIWLLLRRRAAAGPLAAPGGAGGAGGAGGGLGFSSSAGGCCAGCGDCPNRIATIPPPAANYSQGPSSGPVTDGGIQPAAGLPFTAIMPPAPAPAWIEPAQISDQVVVTYGAPVFLNPYVEYSPEGQAWAYGNPALPNPDNPGFTYGGIPIDGRRRPGGF